jgi:GT2 family glycosyltransferase
MLDESPDFPNGLGTDDDWCARARKAGWGLMICLGAFCQHLHSESFKRQGLDRKAMQKVARQRLKDKARGRA